MSDTYDAGYDGPEDDEPVEEQPQQPPAQGGLTPAPPPPAESGKTQAESYAPYTPNLPGEYDPEKAWYPYAVQAVNAIYPRLRDGVDFAIGRNGIDGAPEVQQPDNAPEKIDMGKVEEEARRLSGADPYLDYKPKKPLHTGSEVGDGESDETR